MFRHYALSSYALTDALLIAGHVDLGAARAEALAHGGVERELLGGRHTYNYKC